MALGFKKMFITSFLLISILPSWSPVLLIYIWPDVLSSAVKMFPAFLERWDLRFCSAFLSCKYLDNYCNKMCVYVDTACSFIDYLQKPRNSWRCNREGTLLDVFSSASSILMKNLLMWNKCWSAMEKLCFRDYLFYFCYPNHQSSFWSTAEFNSVTDIFSEDKKASWREANSCTVLLLCTKQAPKFTTSGV